jgi:hypothetical protein
MKQTSLHPIRATKAITNFATQLFLWLRHLMVTETSKMKPASALFLMILLSNTPVLSQRKEEGVIQANYRSLLMLQKKNKNKNAYYEKGDVISFQIKGRKSKIKAEIIDFKDSVIVFQGYEVTIDQIKCLYIDEKTKWWLRYKIAQLSLITGTGYLALEALNTGKIDKSTLAVSGSIICVGLIAKLLISNKIKIRGRTKLKILTL